MFSENKRQLIHVLLFLLAFLLKFLDRWQAAGLLLILLIISVVFVPQHKMRNFLYRPAERKYSQGGILYFLVLLVLVLIFPLPVVAASWAILALGDGMATLLGENFRMKELPWNRQKTYLGTFAFVIFGMLGALILLKWMLPDLTGAFGISLKTAIVAAIVESLPLKINDNITVAVASAVVINFLI